MRMINPADRARVVPTGQAASPSQGRQDTTVSAAPCPLCDGSGWYKEARPAGHPNFGKLFPCDCRIAGEADRQRERQRQRLATFAQEMGGERRSVLLTVFSAIWVEPGNIKAITPTGRFRLLVEAMASVDMCGGCPTGFEPATS